MKVSRRVDLDRQGYRAVAETAIAAAETIVHLERFESIRRFKVVSLDGDTEYRANNVLAVDELTRLPDAEQRWRIDNYHRHVKQWRGRREVPGAGLPQPCHAAIRAFARLEHHCYTTGVSSYEARARAIRGAVRAQIANSVYNLP